MLEVSPLFKTTTNIVFFTVLVSIEKLSHFLTKVKKKVEIGGWTESC